MNELNGTTSRQFHRHQEIRLIAPIGYSYAYDTVGNQTNDNYTGAGLRTYDGENHLKDSPGLSQLSVADIYLRCRGLPHQTQRERRRDVANIWNEGRTAGGIQGRGGAIPVLDRSMAIAAVSCW